MATEYAAGAATPGVESGRRLTVWVAAAAVLGALLVLVATSRHGVGLSPDSVNYVATARSLTARRGYASYDGRPYVAWPPLFPAVLAFGAVLGLDPVHGARLLNALVLGAIVLACGRLFIRTLRSRTLAVIGAFAMLGGPLSGVCSMAWSEPLFVLLTVLCLMAVAAFLEHQKPVALIIAATLGALCCLQRYAGAAMVMAGCTALAAFPPRTPQWRRLGRAALFGAVAVLPVGLWMLRNYAATGTPAGGRSPSELSVWRNLARTVDVTTSWLTARDVPSGIRIAVVAIVAATVLGMSIRSRQRVSPAPRTRYFSVVTLGLFAIVFTAFQVMVSSLMALDRIGDRLLIPLYVPAVFFALLAADEALAALASALGRPRTARAIVLAAVAPWLLSLASATRASTLNRFLHGAGGYATDEWVQSPTIGYVRAHRLGQGVYSNAPDALYILAGLEARWACKDDEALSDFRLRVASDREAYLVWFKRTRRRYVVRPEMVDTMLPLEELAVLSDGTVYQMR